MNLQNATDELIHHLHAGNPSMQISGNRRRVKVAGHDGLVTNMASNSPFGGPETDVLLTVARPEGLFYMIFIAPQQEFRNLQAVFDQMVSSIRFNNS